MIYLIPDPNDPIRQGDIFRSIPFVSMDPSELPVVRSVDELDIGASTWLEEAPKGNVQALVTIRPVLAIVASQDCDTAHQEQVTLFLIDECLKVLGKDPPQSTAKQIKWWIDRITEDSRREQRWFYLPPDPRLGFSERMAANFHVTIPVSTLFLDSNRTTLRIGRLNDEADEHFREQIAQYFRRYPVDEWYPLNKEEFQVYTQEKSRQDTPPREWQS